MTPVQLSHCEASTLTASGPTSARWASTASCSKLLLKDIVSCLSATEKYQCLIEPGHWGAGCHSQQESQQVQLPGNKNEKEVFSRQEDNLGDHWSLVTDQHEGKS